MQDHTAQKIVNWSFRALLISALLAIIAMCLSDYTAERRKLEQVRSEVQRAQCDRLQNAFECNTYGRASALSK